MLVLVFGIDDIDRLFPATHPFEEERIDHGTLFLWACYERARVEVMAELRLGECG